MGRFDTHGLGVEVTKHLDVYDNFFHIMRFKNPKKLKYIQSLHPKLNIAYSMFMDDNREVTARACEIYIEVEDNQTRGKFGRFLKDKGLYTNRYSYYGTYHTIFKPEGMIRSYDAFLRIKESNKLYEEFKNGL